MRGLNSREKFLLGICLFTVFAVLNFFAIKWAFSSLGGSDQRIAQLKSTLSDHEMWLQDGDNWASRNEWIAENMPILEGNALGKAQGDLIQLLQDELFKRKIKIDRQALQEPKTEIDYTEISVKLDVRGQADIVIDWLSTLQSRERFVVLKYLELELDSKSKEPEPQAKCEVTIAQWFRPETSDLPEPPTTEPALPVAPPAVEPVTPPAAEPENTEKTIEQPGEDTNKKEVASNESTGFIR